MLCSSIRVVIESSTTSRRAHAGAPSRRDGRSPSAPPSAVPRARAPARTTSGVVDGDAADRARPRRQRRQRLRDCRRPPRRTARRHRDHRRRPPWPRSRPSSALRCPRGAGIRVAPRIVVRAASSGSGRPSTTRCGRAVDVRHRRSASRIVRAHRIERQQCRRVAGFDAQVGATTAATPARTSSTVSPRPAGCAARREPLSRRDHGAHQVEADAAPGQSATPTVARSARPPAAARSSRSSRPPSSAACSIGPGAADRLPQRLQVEAAPVVGDDERDVGAAAFDRQRDQRLRAACRQPARADGGSMPCATALRTSWISASRIAASTSASRRCSPPLASNRARTPPACAASRTARSSARTDVLAGARRMR